MKKNGKEIVLFMNQVIVPFFFKFSQPITNRYK